MGTGSAAGFDLELFFFFGVAAVAVEGAVVVDVAGSGELRGSDCDSSLDVTSGTSCSLSLRFAIVSEFDSNLQNVVASLFVEVCAACIYQF